MRNVIAGEACSVSFDFVEDGTLLGADAASIQWFLRGNDGTLLVNGAISNAAGEQGAVVPIAAQYNTNALTFEYRTVIVSFTVSGAPKQYIQRYRVTEYLPHTVMTPDILSFLGLTEDELHPGEFDIDASYFVLSDKIGAAEFEAALTSGTSVADKANAAIVGQVVLSIIPSLRLRAFQTKKSDTASVSRFNTLNFDALERAAAQMISVAQDEIDTSVVTPQLAVLSTETDVITGA